LVRALWAKETDVMKMLVAAVTLILSASAAMAEAPCENPVSPPCEKACAAMGAKYVLWRREQDRPGVAQLQTVSANSESPLAAAHRLAGIAGLSLDYVDALSMRQVSQAVETYCPR
jgi:hypothetical protein